MRIEPDEHASLAAQQQKGEMDSAGLCGFGKLMPPSTPRPAWSASMARPADGRVEMRGQGQARDANRGRWKGVLGRKQRDE